ncbi:helix-turn-helix domain-containing protein [Candidatus Collinsella stercoripullorum]|uniref:helix-turn-helix domain-containing protein n=1 Tax=Candidatus Collinsella stercoripullorum TaxID=2838522 RepID=UPI0022E2E8E8|nr:helix-turn-helix transcriptional regulator [Candidatus Collinsella stercoripullorum]
MNVGEQIRRGREALGMSQADLADAIWVSRNTVSNWETGATTPDIQSFVLMSALFGVTIDEMVKGDENVMARAVARDRNRLLVVGTEVSEPGVQGAGSKRAFAAEAADARDADAPITLAMPEPQGSVVFGNYERIDAVRAGMPEFRLVRTFALFSMSDYRIENGAGEAVGAIHRGRATFDPVYQLRVPGFERVQVRREWKPGEFRTVYTIEGEGIGVEGAVLGDEFSIWRHGGLIATVTALRSAGRPVFRIELEDEGVRPLAFGVAMMFLLLRDYDRHWVRTSGE